MDIRIEREKRGLSQRALAALAGIRQATLIDAELGRRAIHTSTLRAIEAALASAAAGAENPAAGRAPRNARRARTRQPQERDRL
jgi:transcriptional regulator with XRE-family HTH domain